MKYLSLAEQGGYGGKHFVAPPDCPSVELLQLRAETSDDARLLGQLNAVLADDPPERIWELLKLAEKYGVTRQDGTTQ